MPTARVPIPAISTLPLTLQHQFNLPTATTALRVAARTLVENIDGFYHSASFGNRTDIILTLARHGGAPRGTAGPKESAETGGGVL